VARIFRQTFSKLLPEGAEIFTRKGLRYARFENSKGKMQTAPLSKDGKSVIIETPKWYIRYKDADGKHKKQAGYTDLKATEQLAQQLERTAEHVRSGYKPREYESLTIPLITHLDDYKESLLAKGTSQGQARQVYNRSRRIIEGCNFRFWADISANKVQLFLAELRKDTDKKRGFSAQTNNGYLQAIKSFCSWLVMEGRAPRSPLVHLKGLNVQTDRRHDRRALTIEECKALIKAAQNGPVVQKMTGPDRAMLYRVALGSGLRASEIRTLNIGRCLLDNNPPTLVVKAAYSKHRREDSQPITLELANDLIQYIGNRPDDELLFPAMPIADRLAKMLRKDLLPAGIPYCDGSGRYADFHALRHTFITNLARSGVHPKQAMDLARHSNINLTMARYSHTLLKDRAEALKGLPSFNGRLTRCIEQKATGTYNKKPLIAQPKAKATSGATINTGLSCKVIK